MRDDQIYKMNQTRAHNEARLYQQFGFLNTRMESFEAVLSSRWNIFKFILNPKWLFKEVDRVQLEKMKAHDEEMKKAIEEKQAEMKKPKIQIVGALNGR